MSRYGYVFLAQNRSSLSWRFLALLATVALVLVPGSAFAATAVSQNEVAITNYSDGTGSFTTPDADNPETGNEGIGLHTPGQDSGAKNRVIRTQDVGAYQVAWDVNEDAGKNVSLKVSLVGYDSFNANIKWVLDSSKNLSGCESTTVSDDGLVLTCKLGDKPQGSSGVIRPQVFLGNGLDKTSWHATVEMTSDGAKAATSDTKADPYYVSEAPSGNWVKGAPQRTDELTVGGVKGYVVLFPLGMTSGAIGSPRGKGQGYVKNEAVFYDHAFTFPGASALANEAQMTAAGYKGTSCGNLDAGNTALAMPVTGSDVQWKCTKETGQAYPVTKLETTHTSQYMTPDNAPKTYANSKPNAAGYVLTAQIAFWIPSTAIVYGEDNTASYLNTITSQDASATASENPPAIDVQGSSTATESSTSDNAVAVAFTKTGTGGGGGAGAGSYLYHGGFYQSRLLQFKAIGRVSDDQPEGTPANPAFWTPGWSLSTVAVSRPFSFVGLNNLLEHPTEDPFGLNYQFDGQGQVSRGQNITMNLEVVATAPASGSAAAPLAGCMTWNSKQIQLQPLTFNRYTVEAPAGPWAISGTETLTPADRAAAGAYTNLAGQFGNLTIGTNTGTFNRMFQSSGRGTYLEPFDDDLMAKLGVVVEYAYDPKVNPDDPNQTDPTYTGTPGANVSAYGEVAQNSVECNNTGIEGTARTWVAADKVNVGDEYNMVRVRMTGDMPWTNVNRATGTVSQSSGFLLTLQGKVGTDYQGNKTDVNHDYKALYLHSSRSWGTWDPATGSPKIDKCYTNPLYPESGELEKDSAGNTVDPATNGWCNLDYDTAAENNAAPVNINASSSGNLLKTSLDPGGINWKVAGGALGNTQHDRVTIVGIKPTLKKTNPEGNNQIVANGETISFNIEVGASGSATEALVNYVVTDNFPSINPTTGAPTNPYYIKGDESVELTVGADSPGAKCTTKPLSEVYPDLPSVPADGKQVICRFSREVPSNNAEAPLPAGLTGEWTGATIHIVATQKDGIASNGYRAYANIANADTTGTMIVPVGATEVPPNGEVIDLAQNATGSAGSVMPLPHDEGAILKAVDAGTACPAPPGVTLSPDQLAAWQTRCSGITYDDDPSNYDEKKLDSSPTDNGQIGFTLTYSNTGNTRMTKVRFVDVFPWNGDDKEVAAQANHDGIVSGQETNGDGRSPASKFEGQVGFQDVADAETYYVTKDAPSTVSRDPNATAESNVWCVWDPTGQTSSGLAPVGKPGASASDCPTNPYEVTAAYIVATADGEYVNPEKSKAVRLILDTENASCDSLYTNTFGVRVGDGTNPDQLPMRSNDVSALVKCPVYNLGNEVWFDGNNNGRIDKGEPPIPGVTMLLFAADDKGNAVDVNKDGKITSADAQATTKTNSKGLYLFNNLAPGSYIVGVAASNWDAGKPLYSYLSSTDISTTADPNNDVDNDDNGVVRDGAVFSGAVTLGQSKEPTGENPDNNPVANGAPVIQDNRSNLTDDFGFYLPQFDLALRKTLADGQAKKVEIGDNVTFDITVFNQGDVTAKDIEVTDYIPSQLTLNDPDWTLVKGDSTRATILIPGPLKPGESVVVPITFKVAKYASQIDNYSEISKNTPIDDNGKTITTPVGVPIVDIDSVPDAILGNDVLEDDVIDKTPATGDEDDEDIASIIMDNPDVPGNPLPKTGAEVLGPIAAALALLVVGGALLMFSRRRGRGSI